MTRTEIVPFPALLVLPFCIYIGAKPLAWHFLENSVFLIKTIIS